MIISGQRPNWIARLKALVGAGDKIGLFTLPFFVVGAILNLAYPSVFSVGGPPAFLMLISIVFVIGGVGIWFWSVALILMRVPRGELITTGPYRLMKHPIYTGVSLLVLPWLGFLLNTWMGAVIGIVMYVGTRTFAPQEEAELSKTFGPAWRDYCDKVLVPWL